MNLQALILSICLSVPLFGVENIDSMVTKLGAEKGSDRRDAQRSLSALSREQPRIMLIRLAETYRNHHDLEVQSRLEQLLKDLAREWMFYHPQGFLGINFRLVFLADDDQAIEVLQVIPGGAAEEGGLKVRDRILEVQGVDVGDLEGQQAFADLISQLRPGTELDVVLLRKSREIGLRISLGARAIEHTDIRTATREEERKLQEWLAGLRQDAPRSSNEPLGHFQTAEP